MKENPNDAASHYYMGRFHLAKGKAKKALPYLKQTVNLDNTKAKYYSWLGVAYALNKQPKNERKAYEKALSLDRDNLQALIYLAHNHFDKKEYTKALTYYNRVLKLSEENQSALYNRALALKKLGRKPEEKLALKEYLAYYPAGSKARTATKNLNALGDFSYRNVLIGLRTVTINAITFKPFSDDLTLEARRSLDLIGKILEKKSND